ncbi:uncharacterized protein LOC110623461 [Manihot esculenta]|uniref:uncharacterized protein LOC110623461 n=1 Tax=Manihot esculenta TaxID=3983 RepID=UPI000B5D1A8F|nr:uncharacterized protein LOC110623461 [Manihot esculenta]
MKRFEQSIQVRKEKIAVLINEDQNFEKSSEVQESLCETSNKKDKAIEMEQELFVDKSNVSEIYEEKNNEDGDDGQLESEMRTILVESEVFAQFILENEFFGTEIIGHVLGKKKDKGFTKSVGVGNEWQYFGSSDVVTLEFLWKINGK